MVPTGTLTKGRNALPMDPGEQGHLFSPKGVTLSNTAARPEASRWDKELKLQPDPLSCETRSELPAP